MAGNNSRRGRDHDSDWNGLPTTKAPSRPRPAKQAPIVLDEALDPWFDPETREIARTRSWLTVYSAIVITIAVGVALCYGGAPAVAAVWAAVALFVHKIFRYYYHRDERPKDKA